jgi:hypothetical protein
METAVFEPEAALRVPLDELAQIRADYAAGKHAELAGSLRCYLQMNHDKIYAFKRELECREGKLFSLETAVRLFIFDKRTVDPKLDARAQLEEAAKEAWIRHEKGSKETYEEIIRDWNKNYAGAWRLHRTREILSVFNMRKEEYLRVLE